MTPFRVWTAAGMLLLALGASARGADQEDSSCPAANGVLPGTVIGNGCGSLTGSVKVGQVPQACCTSDAKACSAHAACSHGCCGTKPVAAPKACCQDCPSSCAKCCHGKGCCAGCAASTPKSCCQQDSPSCCAKCCHGKGCCAGCSAAVDCLSLLHALCGPQQAVLREIIAALHQVEKAGPMPGQVHVMMVTPFGCAPAPAFCAASPMWAEMLPPPRPLGTPCYPYPGPITCAPSCGTAPCPGGFSGDINAPLYEQPVGCSSVVKATATQAVKPLAPCVTELTSPISCIPPMPPVTPYFAGTPAAPCPWTLHVVEGKEGARLEMQCGDPRPALMAATSFWNAGAEVELRCCDTTRMTCESLTLSVPGSKPVKLAVSGGQVAVSGEFVAATADRLVRAGHDDRILLEGHVRLRYDKDGQHAEVTAGRVVVGLARGHLEVMPQAPITAVHAQKSKEPRHPAEYKAPVDANP